MTDPRRALRPTDLLVAGFLLLLALVGRRSEPECHHGIHTEKSPEASTPENTKNAEERAVARRWAEPLRLHLALATALAGVIAFVWWRFQDDGQFSSILLAVGLGAISLWISWGLHIISTPGPAGAVVLFYVGVLVACAWIGWELWDELGTGFRSDRASVLTFGICTLGAIALDARQKWHKRKAAPAQQV